MALRAKEPFVIALVPTGKAVFAKDQVVPDDIAKRASELVYDDAPKPKRTKGADPA